MAAKQVLISSDDATYYLLPGNSGELTRDGVPMEDTIFGQTFKSSRVGPISWGMNAQAFYKGYPGYQAVLKKSGASTPMTDEAMSVVSGKTYQITAEAKRVLDRTVAVVIEDNAIDHTADVENIDYLFGRITFKATYTVTGSVTMTGAYLAQATIAKFTGFTLGIRADAIRTSDIPALQANGGYHTFAPGLKTVSLDLPAVFTAADLWWDALDSRTEYIIEINPDGLGLSGSIGRGFFQLVTDRQSGDVGALEEETLSFQLAVPYSNLIIGASGLAYPFGWIHAAASPIPTAIKTLLTRMLADQTVYGKYLPDGGTTASAGAKGIGVVTDLSLTGGLEDMSAFTVNMQMSGAPTAV